MYVGILGGGLSGVSFQRFLKCDSEILEKEDRLGGLCRTFCKDRFYYDIGGHILFSKDRWIMRVVEKFLGSNLNLRRRNNKILFKGRFIKYPFENGLGGLDKKDNYECLIGYLRNNYTISRTFKDWIYKTFGKGIAEKYLIAYNQKIWKFPLEKMGCEWADRIPNPPVEDVVKSALGIDTEGYAHQLYFNYSVSGGIESVVTSFNKDGAKFIPGFNVKRIEPVGNKWLVSSGQDEKYYDKLVLTIPMNEAVKCIPKAPRNVLRAAAALRYNSVKVVLIGIKKNSLIDKSAIYIPDPKVLAHRVCFMKYFSTRNAPPGMSSLVAEISMPPQGKLYYTKDTIIIDRVIDDLRRISILDNDRDIVAKDIKTIDYAYVLYDSHYRKNIRIIRDYLASLKIDLLGRFGEFEYINMDEVLKRSLRLASKFNKAIKKPRGNGS